MRKSQYNRSGRWESGPFVYSIIQPVCSRGGLVTVQSLAFLLSALMVAPTLAQPPASWTHQFPLSSPSGRSGHALAYDSNRNQVVLFGGGDANVDFPDTWIWNGSVWTEAFPAVHPPVRSGHAMAFDSGRGQVVLFGGQGDVNTGFIDVNDTWLWNGIIWVQNFPVDSPPARSKSALVYDPGHGQVLLFGGTSPNTIFNDTWVWNGNNWTQLSPAVSPPARYGHSMVYDSAHGQVVLFGGFVSGTGDANDTWVWDGFNWTKKPAGILPPARDSQGMAYDAALGQVVMFGGTANAGFSDLNDTWVWNGVSWSQKFPATPPTPRSATALSYDSVTDQIVLFGGFSRNTGTFLNDTWTFGARAAPNIGAVVNGASFKSGGIVGGELAVVFGTDLTASTGVNSTSTLPLPTEFLNTTVTVGSHEVPILAIDNVNGQQQINFQVPWEVANEGSVNATVTSNGASSAPFSLPVLKAQPGIFNYSSGGKNFGAILHADFQLADTNHPVKAGETVLIYCTGLGAVSSPPADGEPGKAQITLNQPEVMIGGQNASVSFSGLAPGLVGLYQVNAEVPAGLSKGNQPVVISIDTVSSNSVFLPVE